MIGDRNDPSTWSAEALDRLYKDIQAAPDFEEDSCAVDCCARYARPGEIREADRMREWQEKRAALNAPRPVKRFRAFPDWANSVAFYLAAGIFAAVFGSILVRWITGGY
jgi:hypothetical protein